MTGFQVPRCECGHTTGAHRSSGARGLNRVGRGFCMEPSCPCSQYRERYHEHEYENGRCAICGITGGEPDER